MKVIVFSLTRDRLDFTKDCFKSLQDNAGYPFDHYIWDNGSIDGSVGWLDDYYRYAWGHMEPTNIGIAKAMNQLKKVIPECGLVIKMDNDCLVKTPKIIQKIVQLYTRMGEDGKNWVLSPMVEGLIKPPSLGEPFQISDVNPLNYCNFSIAPSQVVGGLFRVMPYDLFMKFEADETLPKAYGVDGQLSKWCVQNKVNMGYIENLTVEHYMTTKGQEEEYPEYFKRKHEEEKI